MVDETYIGIVLAVMLTTVALGLIGALVVLTLTAIEAYKK